MEAADFSGYATKAGIRCSDGRTITPKAFEHMDGMQVPLVWQHGHSDVENVLGHVQLEARDDGMYCHGYFNDTSRGLHAKGIVKHKDVRSLSIYANNLMEQAKTVLHGNIREVSLVLSGANPGALIEQVRIAHGEGFSDEILEDEAVIRLDVPLEHSIGDEDENDPNLEHAEDDEEDDEESVADVVDSMTPKQQAVLYGLLGAAIGDAPVTSGGAAAQSSMSSDNPGTPADQDPANENKDSSDSAPVSSDGSTSTDNPNAEGDLAHQEGSISMTRVFDQSSTGHAGPTISHADAQDIFAKAKAGGSWKDAFLAHVEEKSLAHSVDNLELLFPEAKSVTDDPQWISRRMEWVSSVLNGTRKAPFSRIKTTVADITADAARAKGYIKGNQKVEEVFGMLQRVTGPTTIYKLQSLDRDDIVDITDINVVMWLKAEMRLMIEEELARAILVGDGRSNLSPDKVKDPAGANDGTGIRSILHDNDLYSVKYDLATNVAAKDAVKGLVRARSKYRGSGRPTLFISEAFLTDIMLEEDKFGRSLYATEQELMDKIRVGAIVTVDLFEEHDNLFAIMVSLSDYTIGSTRGGELTSFEDFDIQFNKYRYLQETRLSGALTKPFSAVVIRREAGILATATAPSFNGTTDDITIPTSTGVTYTINDEPVTGTVHITAPTEVEAQANDGYYLPLNSTKSWTYTV